jgi:hypothetical protein
MPQPHLPRHTVHLSDDLARSHSTSVELNGALAFAHADALWFARNRHCGRNFDPQSCLLLQLATQRPEAGSRLWAMVCVFMCVTFVLNAEIG